MNAYLRAAHANLAAIRTEGEAIQTRAATEGRDLTEDELSAITRAADQAHELHTAVTEMQAEQDRGDATAALAAQVYAGIEGEARPDRVPNLMPSRPLVEHLQRAADEQQAVRVEVSERPTQTRAVVDTTDTGRPAFGIDPQQAREPRRILTAAGVPAQRVDGVSGLVFPVFGAGAAGVAAEGAVKPEYDAITPGTATPQMISVWTSYSRQVGLSVTSFEGRLRNKLAALVAKREDQLVVSKVLATVGIQTYTATTGTYSDTLLGAAALVLASDVAQAPNLAIIAPADVPQVFGGAVGRGGESPEAELRLDLHGMAVYVSSAMTAGTAIVGAWNAASRAVIGMPPTMLVDAMSGLKTNTITSLLEEAVDLAVDEPTGFVSVDFTAA